MNTDDGVVSAGMLSSGRLLFLVTGSSEGLQGCLRRLVWSQPNLSSRLTRLMSRAHKQQWGHLFSRRQPKTGRTLIGFHVGLIVSILWAPPSNLCNTMPSIIPRRGSFPINFSLLWAILTETKYYPCCAGLLKVSLVGAVIRGDICRWGIGTKQGLSSITAQG